MKALWAVVVLLLLISAAVIVLAIRSGDTGGRCAVWQPILTGKSTTLVCTRWDDSRG